MAAKQNKANSFEVFAQAQKGRAEELGEIIADQSATDELVRVNMMITREQKRQLRLRAANTDRSMSEVVRDAIDVAIASWQK